MLSRPLADLSIREKLTRFGMLASTSALLAALVAFMVWDLFNFSQDMVQRLATEAEIVGQNSVSAVLFEDDDAAQEILASLRADRHVRAAALYDEGGRLFAAWKAGPGVAVELPPARTARDEHEFSWNSLRLERRVFFQDARIGSVYLESDLAQMAQRVGRYGFVLVLVFLGAFLAARLTSVRYEAAIARPILGLAETARAVSRDRDYSVRAEGGGRDELGLLVETFNHMLGQIQQRDAELQEARTGLEQRVAERTEALERELQERQRAQRALERSQLQLGEAQRIARVGSWEWDLQAREVSWSDEMRRLLALPREAPAHLDALLDRVHPDDRGAVALALEEAARFGRPFELDHRVVGPDGVDLILHTHATVVHDADGKPQRVVGTGQDVTERRAAEEERAGRLREQLARANAEASERRAALLAEVSALVMSTLDTERNLPELLRRLVPSLAAFASVHLRTATGPAGFAARPELAAAVPPLLAASDRELAEQGEAAGREVVPARNLPGAAGEVIARLELAEGLLLPLRSGQERFGTMLIGTTSRFSAEDVSLARGVADRLAASLENARLYGELRDANRLKDEFLATLSHELRTPLNAIVGWTKLLQAGGLDASGVSRAVSTIERNSRALARLIEDILDVSRIVSGKLRLDLQPVDLDAVVVAALESVRPAASAKGIDIVHEPSAGDLPVWGDAQRLQQVVWNLLSNAIKFTPSGGNVHVHVHVHGAPAAASVTVSDSGVGIEPAFLPHAFDRFRQADSSSTRAHGGLGLGLAIVRHLVELHGGAVEAHSEGRNQGATFTVSLPRRVTRDVLPPRLTTHLPARRAHDGEPADAPRLEGIRVLVVDDEPDTRELVRVMLEQLGAEVSTAASADEAFSVFGQAPASVLLSDIEMPGGDGYSLLRRIRALGPLRGGNVPAAALTAYARSEDRLAALRAGFQIHLPKPVQPIELAAVVASLAQRSDGSAEHRKSSSET